MLGNRKLPALGVELVFHAFGRSTTTVLSNGVASVGPSTTAIIYSGAHAFKRPDGKWFIVRGDGTGTLIYTEGTDSFVAGPTLSFFTNSGARSIERPDGRWLIIHGQAATTTDIYDPIANTIVTGPTLPGTVHDGGQAFERPDGKWVIVVAYLNSTTASSTTYIYDPVANSFATGTSLSATAGHGSAWVQRPNGMYLVVHGNNTATTSNFDVGWLASTSGQGTYTTDVIGETAVAAWDRLTWGPTSDSTVSMEVRNAPTAAGVASESYRSLSNGGLIGAGNGQNWLQSRLTLQRTIYGFEVNASGAIMSCNSAGVTGRSPGSSPMRVFRTPTIQNLTASYLLPETTNQLRHGKWVNHAGVRKPYFW